MSETIGDRVRATFKRFVFNSLKSANPYDVLIMNGDRGPAANYRKRSVGASLRRHFDAYGNEGGYISAQTSPIAGQGPYASGRFEISLDNDVDRPVSVRIECADDARYLIEFGKAYLAAMELDS